MRSGKVSDEDREASGERLAYSTSVDDLEGADAAIEAIVENEAASASCSRAWMSCCRRPVPRVEHLVDADHELGAGTQNPERVLGLHFFNPVPVLPLVEVVRSIMTGDEAIGHARTFAQDTLGKVCIDSQDRAGFVVNALLTPYLLSSIRMYESGFASKEGIDEGMIKGCAHPMGRSRSPT